MTLEAYSLVSHREHRTWMAWLDNQLNEPNRTDHYIMRAAQAIVQCHVKDSSKVTMDHFKVEFHEVVPKTAEQTADEITERMADDRMRSLGGYVIIKDHLGNVIHDPANPTESQLVKHGS